MKIGILTSSRADYGIYLPLLKKMKEDEYFYLKIIAFGTHLSPFYGKTIDQIEKDGFKVNYRIESMLAGDSANAVSTAMALTSMKFADFWDVHKKDFDLVFCLGDRYEMFAAVTAGIPFGIRFAHLHGGERTLGAIDNIFRHTITLSSAIHFVSTNEYAVRVEELTEKKEDIYVVGALSLDNLNDMQLLSVEEFKNSFDIDLNIPTILITFHPETVNPENNSEYARTVSKVLEDISDKYQIVITLPNADTEGGKIRDEFLKLPEKTAGKVICVENFGTFGYFSCLKHCKFLLGNTSSGIIEAASFKKMVINIGNRQKGRACGNNVIQIDINKKEILEAIKSIEQQPQFEGNNLYYNGGAVHKIIETLKEID